MHYRYGFETRDAAGPDAGARLHHGITKDREAVTNRRHERARLHNTIRRRIAIRELAPGAVLSPRKLGEELRLSFLPHADALRR